MILDPKDYAQSNFISRKQIVVIVNCDLIYSHIFINGIPYGEDRKSETKMI